MNDDTKKREPRGNGSLPGGKQHWARRGGNFARPLKRNDREEAGSSRERGPASKRECPRYFWGGSTTGGRNHPSLKKKEEWPWKKTASGQVKKGSNSWGKREKRVKRIRIISSKKGNLPGGQVSLVFPLEKKRKEKDILSYKQGQVWTRRKEGKGTN